MDGGASCSNFCRSGGFRTCSRLQSILSVHNYIPIERLAQRSELFSKLESLRFAFAACFGPAAIAPFQSMRELHGELISTASVLMKMIDAAGLTGGYGGADSGADLRARLWGGMNRPDQFDLRLDEAMTQIETLCRPVLEVVKP